MKHTKSHPSRKFHFEKKMTNEMREWYESVILWFTDGVLDRRVVSRATRRGHKHFVNPAETPSYKRYSNKKRLTPAEYRKLTIATNKARKVNWLAQIRKDRQARARDRMGV